MKFQEMNLNQPLQRAIHDSGYTDATPIQAATIPLALQGKDILGCAQTGTGKTAAFVLPILSHLMKTPISSGKRPIRALILAPTRELAIQNDEVFTALGRYAGLRMAVIYGGVGQNPQVKALKEGIDVLVATPGRLLDLIHQGFVSLSALEIFVLDEADRMLDMGFIHDVKAIIALLPKKRQTLLFSATMPPEVESLAVSLLSDPSTVKVDPVTSTVDKIRQSIYFVGKDRKKDLLLWLLNEKGVYTALVFTRTKSNANLVVKILGQNGISAMAIHGNKSQNARQLALSSFKEGKISVLVATDIAARGIDITELPFVINYNIPEEPETYIHRIGRTGRAGLGGSAISICSAEDLQNWRDVEKLIKISVPVEKCPWSVENMTPEKRVKQTGGQRNYRQPPTPRPLPEPEAENAAPVFRPQTESNESPASQQRFSRPTRANDRQNQNRDAGQKKETNGANRQSPPPLRPNRNRLLPHANAHHEEIGNRSHSARPTEESTESVRHISTPTRTDSAPRRQAATPEYRDNNSRRQGQVSREGSDNPSQNERNRFLQPKNRPPRPRPGRKSRADMELERQSDIHTLNTKDRYFH